MKQKGLPGLQKKPRRVYPNQYICTELANGVMCNGNFYPYQIMYSPVYLNISVPNNKAYYFRNAILFVYADVGILGKVFVYDDVNQYANVTVFGKDADVKDIPIKMLFFYPKELNFEFVDTLDGFVTVFYAVIDLLPGELNPKVIIE
jgi:hypothetical protein